MSRVRRAKGIVVRRWDRMYDKRYERDPFFLIGTIRGPQAPVKYSRCKICVGNPHHAPDFTPWGLGPSSKALYLSE